MYPDKINIIKDRNAIKIKQSHSSLSDKKIMDALYIDSNSYRRYQIYHTYIFLYDILRKNKIVYDYELV